MRRPTRREAGVGAGVAIVIVAIILIIIYVILPMFNEKDDDEGDDGAGDDNSCEPTSPVSNAATYIKSSSGSCIVNTCNTGYSLSNGVCVDNTVDPDVETESVSFSLYYKTSRKSKLYAIKVPEGDWVLPNTYRIIAVRKSSNGNTTINKLLYPLTSDNGTLGNHPGTQNDQIYLSYDPNPYTAPVLESARFENFIAEEIKVGSGLYTLKSDDTTRKYDGETIYDHPHDIRRKSNHYITLDGNGELFLYPMKTDAVAIFKIGTPTNVNITDEVTSDLIPLRLVQCKDGHTYLSGINSCKKLEANMSEFSKGTLIYTNGEDSAGWASTPAPVSSDVYSTMYNTDCGSGKAMGGRNARMEEDMWSGIISCVPVSKLTDPSTQPDGIDHSAGFRGFLSKYVLDCGEQGVIQDITHSGAAPTVTLNTKCAKLTGSPENFKKEVLLGRWRQTGGTESDDDGAYININRERPRCPMGSAMNKLEYELNSEGITEPSIGGDWLDNSDTAGAKGNYYRTKTTCISRAK